MAYRSQRREPVLLVADENERQQLEPLIPRDDYRLIWAPNGEVGLDRWSEIRNNVRLVITRGDMEPVDGFEVIKTIRAQQTHATFILFAVSSGDHVARRRAIFHGADDCLAVPFVPEEVELRLLEFHRRCRLADQVDLVVALAEVIAERSGESGAHLHRVQGYCRILAEDLRRNHPEFGLTPQQVSDIAHLSVLHDIGKSGIADGLLTKRGRYSDKEYEVIKEHTVIGGEILERLATRIDSDYLWLGHELVLYHHERWDGRGYPLGLKGDEIPLSGRIMAFADVYDALVTRRPHKDPFSVAHAELYLNGESGSHFDPDIVAAYSRNSESFIAVHENFPEPDSDW